MFRKYLAPAAALFAAAALSLTACGTTDGTAVVENGAERQPSLFAGTALANKAKQDTGDWATGTDGTVNTARRSVAERWVQVEAGQAGELNPVLINGAGLTLYRFDKDTASPSKSNCDGECATTWPPVTVAKGGKIFVAGMEKSAIGVVKRDDGRLQVTVGGWPVYRFAKDLRPGDTNGQGVGGTWFGVAPDGQKAGVTGDETGATSVVLFDDPEFSENGASQGLAGSGCQNVARPGVASSVSASGSLKLWSEKDCEGESAVVDGDVRDLAALDFDDTVASVFLG